MSNKDNNHIVDVNKKVSSVEWLIETLLKRGFKYKVDETIAQAKAMHKEEIEEAYTDGKCEGSTCASQFEWGVRTKEITPEQYYNETYGEY